MLCRSFVIRILTLGVALAIGASICAAEPVTSAEIDKIIHQLGSNEYAEREAASKALDRIGAPALEPLRKVLESGEVETRRRAEALIERIGKRQEAARLLAPTKITFRCQDTSLTVAVQEFAKKTGQSISLGGDTAKFADRKLTLDLADAPIWQAVDEFCQKAGLVEAASVDAPLTIDQQLRPGRGIRRIQVEMVRGNAVVLVDGKFTALPTHYSGAARVRALPAQTPIQGAPRQAGEILFAVGLATETKLPVESILSTHIERAVDEHGQSLEEIHAAASAPGDPVPPVFIGNLRGVPQAIIGTAGQGQIPIRLKAGEKAARKLKEVTGTIAVEARTQYEPVLTIDNILKATGKTARGKNGGFMTLQNIARDTEGQLVLTVELEVPPDNELANVQMTPRQIQRFQIQGAAIQFNGGFNSSGVDELGLSLVNAKGDKFPIVGNPVRKINVNNNQVSWELKITFKPPSDQDEPAKLIFSSTRLVAMDIPFVLKDVPLP